MKEDKFNTNEATLSVDSSEATQAVKENPAIHVVLAAGFSD